MMARCIRLYIMQIFIYFLAVAVKSIMKFLGLKRYRWTRIFDGLPWRVGPQSNSIHLQLTFKPLQQFEFDFNNAAGFSGRPATVLDAQHVVYYFSHAMLFCSGVLIEPHVVLTPAVCVYAEEYMFDVFGGSHKFMEGRGTKRYVENICMHRGYNHTKRWDKCVTDNIALLVLDSQFVMRNYEPKTEYIMNRVRYGVSYEMLLEKKIEPRCRYYGWGSRRNGFLLPLLIELRRVDVNIMDSSKCEDMFNTDGKYLCLSQPNCINEKFGALCPDDLGSVVVCGGYIQGMMTSELIDRPCGVGFLNLEFYFKFLECAVDDSRDAIRGAPPDEVGREMVEPHANIEIKDQFIPGSQPENETQPAVPQEAERMGRYYEQDY